MILNSSRMMASTWDASPRSRKIFILSLATGESVRVDKD